MTQNTVRDSRESPNKQETGILNRLAYCAQLNYMLISFRRFKNFTDVKKFPSGFLLPFLLERLVGTKYLFSQKGRFAFKKKNLLVI